MHTRIGVAVGLLAGVLLGGPAALAETSGPPGECPRITAVERIDGTVMNIDTQQGVLTLLGSDGTIHKFQASQETLQDLRIGDKIQTKLRISEKCRRN